MVQKSLEMGAAPDLQETAGMFDHAIASYFDEPEGIRLLFGSPDWPDANATH